MSVQDDVIDRQPAKQSTHEPGKTGTTASIPKTRQVITSRPFTEAGMPKLGSIPYHPDRRPPLSLLRIASSLKKPQISTLRKITELHRITGVSVIDATRRSEVEENRA
jgi:hypothetical protein